MKENRPAQQKRKMPLKQRAAIAIVRFVEGREQKKAQRKQPQAGRTSAPPRKSGHAPAAQRPRTAAEIQRAKQAALVRRQRRRRKQIRIAVAAAVLLVVLIVLSRTVFFKIEHIEITNPKSANYTADQIVAQTGIVYGTQNLFSCDLDKVAKNIEQRLPYIGKAEVERDFPSTLQVTVTPTKASAAMAYGTGYLLIDEKGKMLESTEVPPDGIPVLRCETEFEMNLGQYIGVSANGRKPDEKAEAAAQMIDLYQAINDAVKKAQLSDVTLIDIRDDRAITLMYQNRLTLHLGDSENIERKLQTAVKIIAAESDSSQSRIGAINLTHLPSGYSRDLFESAVMEETTDVEATTEAKAP